MRTRIGGLAAVAMAGGLTMGCLQKDVTETWVVDRDAQVIWTVAESNVRSDAAADADRLQEETAYITAANRQDHPVARGFQQMGFTDVRTQVLRDSVPFTVVTEAVAGRIDVTGQRLIDALQLSGTSALQRSGNVWQWTLTARDLHSENATPVSDGITAVTGDLDALHVVLTSGRFDDAQGFDLSSDRRAATFSEATAVSKADDSVILRLRWTTW